MPRLLDVSSTHVALVRRRLLSAAAAAAVLASAGAAAASTASLVWTAGAGGVISGLGTSDVTVSDTVAATLSLDVRIDVDGNGMNGGEIDFEFDIGAELDDELDIVALGSREIAWSNPSGTRRLSPIDRGPVSTQESTAAREGQLFSFDGATVGNGPKNTTLTFARMVFVTNPTLVETDGDDVFNTLERDEFIGLYTQDGTTCFAACTSGELTASVNVVPEPGTLALLGLGLGTLAFALARKRGYGRSV